METFVIPKPSEDLNLLSLAKFVDEQNQKRKQDLMEYVVRLKAAWDEEKALAIAAESQLGVQKLAAKQEEIEDLKEKLLVSHSGAQKARAYLTKTADLLGNTKGYANNHKNLATVMYNWRNWSRRQSLIKQRIKQAVFIYDSRKLKGKTFHFWKQFAHIELRARVRREFDTKLEQSTRQVWGDVQERINSLSSELAQTQAALAAELEARARLEQDMKQAFMRGVCALNLEAMSVMKRGVPVGGAPPLPAALQAQDPTASGGFPPHPRASAPPSPHPLPGAAGGVMAVSPVPPQVQPSAGLISASGRRVQGRPAVLLGGGAASIGLAPVAEVEMGGMNRIASVAWTGYDGSGEVGSGDLAAEAESLQGSSDSESQQNASGSEGAVSPTRPNAPLPEDPTPANTPATGFPRATDNQRLSETFSASQRGSGVLPQYKVTRGPAT